MISHFLIKESSGATVAQQDQQDQFQTFNRSVMTVLKSTILYFNNKEKR